MLVVKLVQRALGQVFLVAGLGDDAARVGTRGHVQRLDFRNTLGLLGWVLPVFTKVIQVFGGFGYLL